MASVRAVAAFLLLASGVYAQFRSTVPLVIAPTTVADSHGRYVDGLTPEDLILYDNNVPQTIQMDWTAYPISLVVAVQTSDNAGAVIDKLGGSGILLTQLVAADKGETALITYSDNVKLHQDFTTDADAVTHALRMLRKEGGRATALDAVQEALTLLNKRPTRRRRVVLVIGEKKDRASAAKLAEVVEQIQRQNAAIYWLTFSPFLQPFTVKPKTVEETKPEAERIKVAKCATCPKPDDSAAPPDLGPGSLVYGLGELFRMSKPDLADLFTRTTGGRTMSFLKKEALEHAIQFVGEEIHRQYILSFSPNTVEPGKYHDIRVVVKGRPELQVRTREGYWAVE